MPTYARPDLVERCLSSLAGDGYPGRREILVVEDGPAVRGQDQMVRSLVPEATTMSLGTNRGFVEAANRGIERALSHPDVDLVTLLNNDVVVTPGWLVELTGALLGRGWDFAVPRMQSLEYPDLIDGDGDQLTKDGTAQRRHRGRSVRSVAWENELIAFPTGGACLIRRTAWALVGGYDGRLHMYYEDVDWGVRATAAGLCGGATAESIVFHAGSQSTSRRYAVTQCFANQVLVSLRRFPRAYFLRYGPRWTLGVARSLCYTAREAGWGPTIRSCRRVAGALPEAVRSRRELSWSPDTEQMFVDSLVPRARPRAVTLPAARR